MATVVPFSASPEAVSDAWERHRTLAAALIANPTLLLDRAHMEAATVAEDNFRRTYLRSIAGNRTEAR